MQGDPASTITVRYKRLETVGPYCNVEIEAIAGKGATTEEIREAIQTAAQAVDAEITAAKERWRIEEEKERKAMEERWRQRRLEDDFDDDFGDEEDPE